MAKETADVARDTRLLQVKLFRYNNALSQESHYDEYEVPAGPGQSVMNVLQYIYENLDRSISFYAPCRIGRCFGCHAKVNGKTRLVCTELPPTDSVNLLIEPMSDRSMLRDVITDRSKLVSTEEQDLAQKADAYLASKAQPAH
ncbi:MAG TPA: 2Fe-2S iron-sulfur cluster-binding protein [Chloroflexota bacterium]